MKTCLFGGSFDPVHAGHLHIAAAAQHECGLDEVVFLPAACSPFKQGRSTLFTDAQRLHMLQLATAHLDNVICSVESGLTAVFAKEHDAVIIKGIRNGTDLDYEMTMYGINRAVEGVDTMFVPAKQEYMHISSTFVREMLRYEHDFEGLVPAPVYRYLCEEWKNSST